MRAWILALVQTVWTLHGLQDECWTERCDQITTDCLRPRAR